MTKIISMHENTANLIKEKKELKKQKKAFNDELERKIEALEALKTINEDELKRKHEALEALSKIKEDELKRKIEALEALKTINENNFYALEKKLKQEKEELDSKNDKLQ